MNNIIQKIKEFFYKLKKDKKVLLVEDTNSINEKNQDEFKKSLDVTSKQKIVDIQNKYESGEILDKELNPFQVLDLIDLYKKQINDLNIEISIKKRRKRKNQIFDYRTNKGRV